MREGWMITLLPLVVSAAFGCDTCSVRHEKSERGVRRRAGLRRMHSGLPEGQLAVRGAAEPPRSRPVTSHARVLSGTSALHLLVRLRSHTVWHTVASATAGICYARAASTVVFPGRSEDCRFSPSRRVQSVPRDGRPDRAAAAAAAAAARQVGVPGSRPVQLLLPVPRLISAVSARLVRQPFEVLRPSGTGRTEIPRRAIFFLGPFRAFFSKRCARARARPPRHLRP